MGSPKLTENNHTVSTLLAGVLAWRATNQRLLSYIRVKMYSNSKAQSHLLLHPTPQKVFLEQRQAHLCGS